MSSNISIQGQLLEIRVVDFKLKDKERFTSHEYYVVVEYGNSTWTTKTCPHGGKNPSFKEKFQIPLIDGLKVLKITIWNKHKDKDTHIGSGWVKLHTVLSDGVEESRWTIETTHNKYAGEVNLELHFSGAAKKEKGTPPPAPLPYWPYVPQPPPYPYHYGGGYPPNYGGYPPNYGGYPPWPPANNQYPPGPYPPPQYNAQYGQPWPHQQAPQPPYNYPQPGQYPGPSQ